MVRGRVRARTLTLLTPTPTPTPDGAALSSTWLEEHVERVVLIGAPLLGAPKVIAGLLMG